MTACRREPHLSLAPSAASLFPRLCSAQGAPSSPNALTPWGRHTRTAPRKEPPSTAEPGRYRGHPHYWAARCSLSTTTSSTQRCCIARSTRRPPRPLPLRGGACSTAAPLTWHGLMLAHRRPKTRLRVAPARASRAPAPRSAPSPGFCTVARRCLPATQSRPSASPPLPPTEPPPPAPP